MAYALLPVVLVGCTSTRTVRMRLDPPTAATRMQNGEASVRVAAYAGFVAWVVAEEAKR